MLYFPKDINFGNDYLTTKTEKENKIKYSIIYWIGELLERSTAHQLTRKAEYQVSQTEPLLAVPIQAQKPKQHYLFYHFSVIFLALSPHNLKLLTISPDKLSMDVA